MNKVKLIDAVNRGSHARKLIQPNILISDGNYASGDLLDANTTEKMVDDKIDSVVDGAVEALDTLKELGNAIPTKVSQLTNDAGYITENDGHLLINQLNITVISNQPFPSSWPTDNSHTLQGLVNAIDADQDAVQGKVYMATVHYSDLYDAVGLVDGELKVEIMQSSGSHKIARFTITSANASPYYWQNTMWDGTLHDVSNVSGKKWVSFLPSTTTIPTIPTDVSSFNNDAGYLTSHQDISGKANAATTLAGYGITDAKIEGSTITLGSNTITPLTSHLDISGKANSSDLATVATSGSYTDLLNKPTIPVIWSGTQAAYDLLTPDANTIYIITPEVQ